MLLCEIEEARVQPWGYRGRNIIDLLAGWRYEWFTIGEKGDLAALPPDREQFNGNYVAVPIERASVLARGMAGSAAPIAGSAAASALRRSG